MSRRRGDRKKKKLGPGGEEYRPLPEGDDTDASVAGASVRRRRHASLERRSGRGDEGVLIGAALTEEQRRAALDEPSRAQLDQDLQRLTHRASDEQFRAVGQELRAGETVRIRAGELYRVSKSLGTPWWVPVVCTLAGLAAAVGIVVGAVALTRDANTTYTFTADSNNGTAIRLGVHPAGDALQLNSAEASSVVIPLGGSGPAFNGTTGADPDGRVLNMTLVGTVLRLTIGLEDDPVPPITVLEQDLAALVHPNATTAAIQAVFADDSVVVISEAGTNWTLPIVQVLQANAITRSMLTNASLQAPPVGGSSYSLVFQRPLVPLADIAVQLPVWASGLGFNVTTGELQLLDPLGAEVATLDVATALQLVSVVTGANTTTYTYPGGRTLEVSNEALIGEVLRRTNSTVVGVQGLANLEAPPTGGVLPGAALLGLAIDTLPLYGGPISQPGDLFLMYRGATMEHVVVNQAQITAGAIFGGVDLSTAGVGMFLNEDSGNLRFRGVAAAAASPGVSVTLDGTAQVARVALALGTLNATTALAPDSDFVLRLGTGEHVRVSYQTLLDAVLSQQAANDGVGANNTQLVYNPTTNELVLSQHPGDDVSAVIAPNVVTDFVLLANGTAVLSQTRGPDVFSDLAQAIMDAVNNVTALSFDPATRTIELDQSLGDTLNITLPPFGSDLVGGTFVAGNSSLILDQSGDAPSISVGFPPLGSDVTAFGLFPNGTAFVTQSDGSTVVGNFSAAVADVGAENTAIAYDSATGDISVFQSVGPTVTTNIGPRGAINTELVFLEGNRTIVLRQEGVGSNTTLTATISDAIGVANGSLAVPANPGEATITLLDESGAPIVVLDLAKVFGQLSITGTSGTNGGGTLLEPRTIVWDLQTLSSLTGAINPAQDQIGMYQLTADTHYRMTINNFVAGLPDNTSPSPTDTIVTRAVGTTGDVSEATLADVFAAMQTLLTLQVNNVTVGAANAAETVNFEGTAVTGSSFVGNKRTVRIDAVVPSDVHLAGAWDPRNGTAPSDNPLSGAKWVVTANGNTSLNGTTDWHSDDFVVWVVDDTTGVGTWYKIDNTPAGIRISFNDVAVVQTGFHLNVEGTAVDAFVANSATKATLTVNKLTLSCVNTGGICVLDGTVAGDGQLRAVYVDPASGFSLTLDGTNNRIELAYATDALLSGGTPVSTDLVVGWDTSAGGPVSFSLAAIQAAVDTDTTYTISSVGIGGQSLIDGTVGTDFQVRTLFTNTAASGFRLTLDAANKRIVLAPDVPAMDAGPALADADQFSYYSDAAGEHRRTDLVTMKAFIDTKLTVEVDNVTVGTAGAVSKLVFVGEGVTSSFDTDGGETVFVRFDPSLPSTLNLRGNWDASGTEPPDTDPQLGDYYIVTVEGNFSLNGTTDWHVGDNVIWTGERWIHVDNTPNEVMVQEDGVDVEPFTLIFNFGDHLNVISDGPNRVTITSDLATTANVNTAGIGLFKQRTALNDELYGVGVAADNPGLAATLDAVDNLVRFALSFNTLIQESSLAPNDLFAVYNQSAGVHEAVSLASLRTFINEGTLLTLLNGSSAVVGDASSIEELQVQGAIVAELSQPAGEPQRRIIALEAIHPAGTWNATADATPDASPQPGAVYEVVGASTTTTLSPGGAGPVWTVGDLALWMQEVGGTGRWIRIDNSDPIVQTLSNRGLSVSYDAATETFTVALDVGNLQSLGFVGLNDRIAIFDTSDSNTRSISLTQLQAAINTFFTAASLAVSGGHIYAGTPSTEHQFYGVGPTTSGRISVALNLTTGKQEFDVVEGNVQLENLSGYEAVEHVPHDQMGTIAGEGLAGGGDGTAFRTLSVDVAGLPDETAPNATNTIMVQSAGGLVEVSLADLFATLQTLLTVQLNNVTVGAANSVTKLSFQGTAVTGVSVIGPDERIVHIDAVVPQDVHLAGAWNASEGGPPNENPVSGEKYVVTQGGATNLNGTTDWQSDDFVIWIVNAETGVGSWYKIDNTPAGIALQLNDVPVVATGFTLNVEGTAVDAFVADSSTKGTVTINRLTLSCVNTGGVCLLDGVVGGDGQFRAVYAAPLSGFEFTLDGANNRVGLAYATDSLPSGGTPDPADLVVGWDTSGGSAVSYTIAALQAAIDTDTTYTMACESGTGECFFSQLTGGNEFRLRRLISENDAITVEINGEQTNDRVAIRFSPGNLPETSAVVPAHTITVYNTATDELLQLNASSLIDEHTLANVNTAGVGVWKQRVGDVDQLRGVAPAPIDSGISIAENPTRNTIDVAVDVDGLAEATAANTTDSLMVSTPDGLRRISIGNIQTAVFGDSDVGHLWGDGTTGQTITSAGTGVWTKIARTGAALDPASSSGFSEPVNGRLLYSGDTTRTFNAFLTVSAGGTDDQPGGIAIGVDGTVVSKCQATFRWEQNTEEEGYSTTCLLTLAPGQYVEAFAINRNDAGSFVLFSHHLLLHSSQGGQGIQGVPGSGSTIVLKNGTSLVANTPHSIIRAGNGLEFTDLGGGEAVLNAIASGASSYGFIWWRSTTNFVITGSQRDSDGGALTTVAPTGIALGNPSVGFDMPVAGRLRYTAATTAVFNIGVDFTIGATNDRDIVMQLFKNGVAVANSRTDVVGADTGKEEHIGLHVLVELATNDYLQLRVQNTENSDAVSTKTFRMVATPAVGPRGPAGSGSTIAVSNNGVAIAPSPSVAIDCRGALTCTDAGGSTARAEVVYGSQRTYGASEALSTTTSTTMQQKLRVTTGVLPSGTYRVEWYAEVSSSSADEEVLVRVQLDDATDIGNINYEPDVANSYISFSGFWEGALSGTTNIDMDYRVEAVGTAAIRKARISLIRVA